MGRRPRSFTKLKEDLEIHEAIEEETFYPALAEQAKAREQVLEPKQLMSA